MTPNDRQPHVLWTFDFVWRDARHVVRITCGSTREEIAWETCQCLFWVGVLALVLSWL